MEKVYLTKKEIKLNKVYDIEYMWGGNWEKGWGRLYPSEGIDTVNVISLDGGVSNVIFDKDIRFIKLTNVK